MKRKEKTMADKSAIFHFDFSPRNRLMLQNYNDCEWQKQMSSMVAFNDTIQVSKISIVNFYFLPANCQ